MVNFQFQRGLLRINEMAFGSFSDIDRSKKSDVVYMHSNEDALLNIKDASVLAMPQPTLVNNLSDNEDSLFKKISKTCRYEIRRAEREGCTINHYTSSELEQMPEIVLGFETSYNNMFKSKGLYSYSFNKKMVQAGIVNKSIIISTCSDLEGKYTVYHAYLVDGNSCVLLYSASPLWDNKGGYTANLIGWMNKCLHWNDILFFKRSGYLRYEWGGISSMSQPNGIDLFKMSFGGNLQSFNNYIVANSILGKIYILLVKTKYKNR